MEPAIHSVTKQEDLPAALAALGLEMPRPALVIVGGAGGMPPELVAETAVFFERHLVPLIRRHNLVVIDGGTNSGIMEAMGNARARYNADFPLVGVVVEALVKTQCAELQKEHSHFLFVPGDKWGDEVAWLSMAATAATAGVAPSATILVNGGKIAWNDVETSIVAGRPVFVAEGSGRTADDISKTRSGAEINVRAVKLIASGKVTVVNPYRFPEKFLLELEKTFTPK